MQEYTKPVKARSHCTGRCNENTKLKKVFPSVEKHYASVVYSLRTCTYFVRSIHQESVQCDFIRLKSYELHKTC